MPSSTLVADSAHRSKELCKRWAGPVVGIILFGVAIYFLYGKMQEITWDEFVDGLASIPPRNLILAGLLVAFNYFVLTGNDVVAIQYVGAGDASDAATHTRLGYGKIALASFLGYAFANNIGTVAAGIPLRARFYGAWGVRPAQIVGIVAFLGVSFWVGFCCVGGVFLSLVEVPTPRDIKLPVTSKVLGFVLLVAAAVYIAAGSIWRRSISLRGLSMRPPGPDLMFRQISVASLDLIVAATTLYMLLPQDIAATYPQIVGVYVLALAAAMLTQVPGGIGVLEAILLSLLIGSDKGAVVGALLIFRLFYYVMPLIVAAVMLVIVESRSTIVRTAD